jgi:sensor domain CHASE-containing protein
MTLGKKAIVSITVTSLLLSAVLLLLSKQVIPGSSGRLEAQNIRQNAQRTVSMLEDEIARLESTLPDWSNRDDTYPFP